MRERAQAPLLDLSKSCVSADMLLLSKPDLLDARIAADFTGSSPAAMLGQASGTAKDTARPGNRKKTDTAVPGCARGILIHASTWSG
jgi:hypothetical protein